MLCIVFYAVFLKKSGHEGDGELHSKFDALLSDAEDVNGGVALLQAFPESIVFSLFSLSFSIGSACRAPPQWRSWLAHVTSLLRKSWKHRRLCPPARPI
jgi:hypothetical protein